MDEAFKIRDKASLEKIICNNCKNLLNVSPVFCVKEGDSIIEVCGRCNDKLKQDENVWRQYAYENLAQLFTYPCANKKLGCGALLKWNQVLDHELICEYQKIICPLSHTELFPDKGCDWTGLVNSLNNHIESSHKDYIKTPPELEWHDCSESNHIFFTYVGIKLVTVVIKYDSKNKFYCLLMLNGNSIESQCYRYQLELYNESRKDSIILRKSSLQPLGCMKVNLETPSKMMLLDIEKIKDLLQHTNVVYGRFGIVKKNKKEIMQICNGVINEISLSPKLFKPAPLPIDENILQELECPVCNEFMIPPIYICQAGHSLCEGCKSRIKTCPNCRCELSSSRNFTLENLTRKVHYPCRNREIGCSFVSTSDGIRGHDSLCELTETFCILQCGHQCLKPAMYSHIIEKHPDDLMSLNTVHVRDVSTKKESFYVLYAFGDLFRFSIKGSNLNPYKFNLQHMGTEDGDPKYRFLFQIIDQSPLATYISFNNICQKMTMIPNTAHATGISIPWNLLKPMLYESKYFYYKITISKLVG
ncbi:uncharacterized protein [Leptinotarsa decemlineata]|uniref:uncharacterized protein n=1 Tax=Leptinotarsa decemlineata TaxID=7539 RepID=UPI000C255A17|nr:uncharacterized protein LOC111504925 [Leptinotarsa decemlineata]